VYICNDKHNLMRHKLFIETYGCQMNLNDTQIVQSLMIESGYTIANSIDTADIVLLNTCSVRDNAEEKIRNRIETLYHIFKKRKTKTILGVIGCMAERLQEKLFASNQVVSLVVGPDEYRKLPELARLAFEGENGIAVDLSKIETYNDVIPLRIDGLTAWVSIMRGCNNFCSYCVVPYTRGRERSRPFESIVEEVKRLNNQGFKEVTLLGQNVNSYSKSATILNDATQEEITNNSNKLKSDFPELLETIAKAVPEMRIRFLTSHPKDFSFELIQTIAKYNNICNYIHLPIQSGSNRILDLMNRRYTVEKYLNLIEQIKQAIPDCVISTDVIAGFPSETIEEHNATLAVMRKIRYGSAFMFKYSPREGTKSFEIENDVSDEEKIKRLNEIIDLQNKISFEENQKEIGKSFEILVENPSKKNKSEWFGRTKSAKLVVFDNSENKYKIGDLLNVKINKATSATLLGNII
jgi:tRNA-2-methylthio-N6-dimethylallyladenosine synthase